MFTDAGVTVIQPPVGQTVALDFTSALAVASHAADCGPDRVQPCLGRSCVLAGARDDSCGCTPDRVDVDDVAATVACDDRERLRFGRPQRDESRDHFQARDRLLRYDAHFHRIGGRRRAVADLQAQQIGPGRGKCRTGLRGSRILEVHRRRAARNAPQVSQCARRQAVVLCSTVELHRTLRPIEQLVCALRPLSAASLRRSRSIPDHWFPLRC